MGKYALIHPLDSGTLGYIKSLDYEIKFNGKIFRPGQHIENKPSTVWRWRWSKDLVEWGIKNNLIVEKNNRLYTKNYRNFKVEKDGNSYKLVKKEVGKPFTSDTLMSEEFGNRIATREIKSLFEGNGYFDYPKPVNLIKKLIKMIKEDENDIILDFFSGSATTAHAVMELNAEDGGNRRFIMVQLPEPTDEKSEAYKAGYKNICEIGKERIRRSGEKIKEDFKDKEGIENLDIGFKVFKLDSSNFKEWDKNADNLEKLLLESEEIIKEDRSEEDLICEILLKYGIDLTTPIEEKEINNKKVYIVEGTLIIYLDEVDIEIAKKIVELTKEYDSEYSSLVLRDDSFLNSKEKVNIIEFFRQMNLFDKIITL
ncbi:hypothetical protein JCM11957_04940 [Caminibacter profundus]